MQASATAQRLEACAPVAVQQWAPQIAQAAATASVPADLLAALVYQESAGDPTASYYSPDQLPWIQAEGAYWDAALNHGWTWDRLATSLGLAQVLGATAWSLQPGITPGEAVDPAMNLSLGARYLARMLARFPAVRDALAAYNAGPAAVANGTAPASSYDTYAANILGVRNQIQACTASGG